VRRCGTSGEAAPIAFDHKASPFARQASAFMAAASGKPHDFSATRDLALMRLFDGAYQEALACL
jgi:1,5-anhydro-D-fructose reductase (1,5-anhydro-D-mannitol-forming)